ncbi:MAG: hypothetical protein KatS3mg013_1313 [Actinomycetota bacterium]|jgi:tight adherence protein B|nr:MAG: hypothetical protein KatS3mg013_1313 [Actinomycetota bacterium]
MTAAAALLAAWAVLFLGAAVRADGRARVRARAGANRRPSPRRRRAAGVDRWLRRRRAAARAARRDEQVGDAVAAIASALRSGMSVPLAIGYAAEEAVPPLADDLAHVVRELEVGVPIDEALEAFADRVASDEARLLVAAVGLHRRVGGDLPTVLDGVADAVRERIDGARELRALTAQARLSGAILGVLPVGFFGFLWLTSPGEMVATVSSGVGLAAIGVGLILDAAAYLWIRRLLEVG